jgi:hypothetical protein
MQSNIETGPSFRDQLNAPMHQLLTEWKNKSNLNCEQIAKKLGIRAQQVSKVFKFENHRAVKPETYLGYIMAFGGSFEIHMTSKHDLKIKPYHIYKDANEAHAWFKAMIKEIMTLGRVNFKGIANDLDDRGISGLNMRNIYCYDSLPLTMMRQASLLGCKFHLVFKMPGTKTYKVDYTEVTNAPVFIEYVTQPVKRVYRRMGDPYQDINVDPVELTLISRMQRGVAQTSLGETVRAFL